MTTENDTKGTNPVAAMGLVREGAKTLAFLAVAFTFVQVGLNIPAITRVAEEQARLGALQTRQLERLIADTEKISAAANDAALIYAARMAAAEKSIPARNADQIVDAATERLAGRFGKEWEVIIRGTVAKLDTLTRR
jgi:hypothetical protein